MSNPNEPRKPSHGSRSWPGPDTTVAAVIATLGLQPLADEGGWWAPRDRSCAASTILFLLADSPDGFSALHRLRVTEAWVWLAGAPAELTVFDDHGPVTHRLDPAAPTAVVPAGRWQGARTLGAWTLVSCCCTPAYQDEDFTLGSRAALIAAHPEHRAVVEGLTRDS